MIRMKSVLYSVSEIARFWAKVGTALAAGALLSTGCESLEKHSAKEGFNLGFLKKKEPPVQIVSTWKPEVIFVPDPANQGRPNPGIVGRIYLFQQDLGTSVTWDGKMEIDMFDLGSAQGAAPVHLERWEYDAASMAKLVRKDPIGDGYTVFLPWGSYREDIQKIQLKLKFDHGGTFPLYGDTGPITLNGPLKMVSHQSTMTPDQYANQPSRTIGPPSQPRMMLDPNAGRPETPLRQVIPRAEHPLQDNRELPPPRVMPGQNNQPMSPGNNNRGGRMELPPPRLDMLPNGPFVPGAMDPQQGQGIRGGLNTPGAAPAPSKAPTLPLPQQLDPSQSRGNPQNQPPAARLELIESTDPSLARRNSGPATDSNQKVWSLK